MSNNSGNNSLLSDVFLLGLKIYVGEKNYEKIEMLGRMVFTEEYAKKCDYYFTGREKSLDCIIKDIYGNTLNHSVKMDPNSSVSVGANGNIKVQYNLGDFRMKVTTYTKPRNGVYFKIDVFANNGPAISRRPEKKRTRK